MVRLICSLLLYWIVAHSLLGCASAPRTNEVQTAAVAELPAPVAAVETPSPATCETPKISAELGLDAEVIAEIGKPCTLTARHKSTCPDGLFCEYLQTNVAFGRCMTLAERLDPAVQKQIKAADEESWQRLDKYLAEVKKEMEQKQ